MRVKSLPAHFRRRKLQLKASQWNDVEYLKSLFDPLIDTVVLVAAEAHKPGSDWAFLKQMSEEEWFAVCSDVRIWSERVEAVIAAVKAGRMTKGEVIEVYNQAVDILALMRKVR